MLTKIYIPSYLDKVKNIKMFDRNRQRFRAFICIAQDISCEYPEYFQNNSNSIFITDIKNEFKRKYKC